LRLALPRVAATARPAAVAPGRLGAAPAVLARLRGLLEAAIAASAAFEPGRVCRVPLGSRSASSGGFFLMTFP
jgi:hypothetical protein